MAKVKHIVEINFPLLLFTFFKCSYKKIKMTHVAHITFLLGKTSLKEVPTVLLELCAHFSCVSRIILILSVARGI